MNDLLPAEWAMQSAIMLTWPHHMGAWSSSTLPAVEQVFIDTVVAVSPYQKLIVTAYNTDHQTHIASQLKQAKVNLNNIRFGLAPSNDIWVRDHGPITVIESGQPVLLDFTFNGWGGKYPAQLDNFITRRLYQQDVFEDMSIRSIDWVLEGGAIESDGTGTLLVTPGPILDRLRNLNVTQKNFGALSREALHCQRVLYLADSRLEGDDTDGHIDTVTRLLNSSTIVFQGCRNTHDSHYVPLQKMAASLSALCTPNDRPYEIHALPLPQAIYSEGKRLPASYANFLITNEAILVPTYGDQADSEALGILANLSPDRRIIGIDCRALIKQFGSLHCATMQIPAT